MMQMVVWVALVVAVQVLVVVVRLDSAEAAPGSRVLHVMIRKEHGDVYLWRPAPSPLTCHTFPTAPSH